MAVTRRPSPHCHHSRLVNCPLDVDDWEKVMLAWLGFKQQCALIAEAAHERERQGKPAAEAPATT